MAKKKKTPECYKKYHNKDLLKKWSDLIIERDSSCVLCDSLSDELAPKYTKDDLEAHHMVPVAYNKTLSISLFNGVCLCKECHQNKVHEYLGSHANFFILFFSHNQKDEVKQFNELHQNKIKVDVEDKDSTGNT